jgi:hypothetical protein
MLCGSALMLDGIAATVRQRRFMNHVYCGLPPRGSRRNRCSE